KRKEEEPLVTGEVIVEKNAGPFSGATVYIYLENTSRADAASRIIASQVLLNFSHQPGHEDRIKFKLFGAMTDPQASCSIRVHIDVDGDGQVSDGDYITMQSYPVLTYGYP